MKKLLLTQGAIQQKKYAVMRGEQENTTTD
jgi:hypothetical protein